MSRPDDLVDLVNAQTNELISDFQNDEGHDRGQDPSEQGAQEIVEKLPDIAFQKAGGASCTALLAKTPVMIAPIVPPTP